MEKRYNEDKVSLEQQVENAKKKVKEKLVILLNQFVDLTQNQTIIWKECSEKNKYMFVRENVAFVLKISKKENEKAVFGIRMMDLNNQKPTIDFDDINQNDGNLYAAAEKLYLVIDRGRIQNDEQMIDMFMKDLK
ncbi:hypothetical protein [Fibrobacter sp. UWB3]|uniref:hypothetical protein n=1 Tax=Fibrobacter sp. UWB3 TaxID=1964357 RepID=UPI000B5202E2|nr:hypothetical protein [Fibrobacter sp. UWB3]OWV18142.1 hypothetical protein B7991_11005 [Fibrobacter sp. UWB3]